MSNIGLSNIIFCAILLASILLFLRNVKRVFRNINLGKQSSNKLSFSDKINRLKKDYFSKKSKMMERPISGFFHFIIAFGFVIINIETLEIIIDGVFGTHRFFASFLGLFYNYLSFIFEIIAVLVIVATIVFFFRRNIVKLSRFSSYEMKGWAKLDGNIILYFELVLMVLFLLINATDYRVFLVDNIVNKPHITEVSFPVSRYIYTVFDDLHYLKITVLNSIFWWVHFVIIMIFMNYLYYSKHLHIFLAVPNILNSKMDNIGKLNNLKSVTQEVDAMLGISTELPPQDIAKFGSSDIFDLSKIQLMNAYSCTECGRCTDVCPVNISGGKLSPRKIMMDTRDRAEVVGRNIDKNGKFIDDNKNLFDLISNEEIWSCTTCNACVEECPILNNPMSIIVDLRRYLVMEKSEMPQEIVMMNANIENNNSPWKLPNDERLDWVKE